MTHLDDRTALITGGGRGIGRAIALQLAQHGARVAVAARSEAELAETTSAIAAAGGRAHAIVADLAAPSAGPALARRALHELGRVDILINNAGVVAPVGASTGIASTVGRIRTAVSDAGASGRYWPECFYAAAPDADIPFV